MKKLRTILRLNEKYLKHLALLLIILSIINIKIFPYKTKYSPNETNFTGIITNIKLKENKIMITIKAKEKLIINYYQKDYLNIYNIIEIGDTINVEGVLNIPNKNTIPSTFNYKKYLSNQKIYYLVKANSITKIKNNTNFIYHIRTNLNNHIDTSLKRSSAYIKTFVLGTKDSIEEDILSTYQTNGVSHLLSISGMHLTILIGTIFKILKKITHNIVSSYLVCIILTFIYMLFLGFTPSILRSGIMYILLCLNKVYNFKLKSINLMYLTLIIILLINHYYITNLGFQLSYLISYFLIITSKLTSKTSNYFIKILITSIISFIVSFPIIIYNFYEVNLIGIILNLIFIPIVSYLILPISFFSLIFTKLDYILIFIINIIEKISIYTSKITITKLIFPKPSLILMITYYFLLILSAYKPKTMYVFLIISIYHYNKELINNTMQITFLDVSQGDSILISYSHNKYNILIDTGGISNYEVTKNTITYLKARGIRKLDYLILTHGDYDHIGSSIYLINNYKVNTVIFNCGPYNDLEKELIKVLDEKNIKYTSCIKELNIDKYKLYFLNTKEYDNENDNSNVIYTELNGYKFMFMADAGVEKEKDILDKYNISDIDVLKVGHHGSKTSSSKGFIDEIDPKYGVISVGKNNRYGHPNKEVLNNLYNSKIYRTDQDGSIMFKIKNNKLKIETCSP